MFKASVFMTARHETKGKGPGALLKNEYQQWKNCQQESTPQRRDRWQMMKLMWKKQEFRTPSNRLSFDFSVRRRLPSVCFSPYSSCSRQSNYSNICKITENNRSRAICWALNGMLKDLGWWQYNPKWIAHPNCGCLSGTDNLEIVPLSLSFPDCSWVFHLSLVASGGAVPPGWHIYIQQKVCTVRKMSAMRTGWKETGE